MFSGSDVSCDSLDQKQLCEEEESLEGSRIYGRWMSKITLISVLLDSSVKE